MISSFFRIAVISLICAFLTACAPVVMKSTKLAPDFSADDWDHGEVSVFGVVSTAKAKFSQAEATQSAIYYQQAYGSLFKKLTRENSSDVQGHLGDEVYKQLLAQYKKNKKFSEKELGQLFNAMPFTRYVIVANITKNETKKSENYDESSGDDVTTYYVARHITVVTTIYDIRMKKQVYRVSMPESYQNSNVLDAGGTTSSIAKALVNALAADAVDSAVRGKSSHYPDAPKASLLIQRAAQSSAKNMTVAFQARDKKEADSAKGDDS